jgi:hypothetical protein
MCGTSSVHTFSSDFPEENDMYAMATPEYIKAIQEERYGRFRHTRPMVGHVGAVRLRRLQLRDDRPTVDQRLAA